MILYQSNLLYVPPKYSSKRKGKPVIKNQRITLPKTLTLKQCLQNTEHSQLQASHSLERGYQNK